MARRQPISGGKSRRSGVASMEFGLVFVGFLLLITGLVELGRGVWTFNTIAHATRQGARVAQSKGEGSLLTQTEVSTQVENAVRNASIGLVRNSVAVSTSWPNGMTRGNFVVVQASYPFRSVVGNLVLRQSSISIQAYSRVPILN